MKSIRVVAAVIRDGDKTLSCQRGYGDLKDGWEFPGGKVEPGESGEQAIIREIQEELSVTIGNLEYLCTAEHDYPTFHISMECYLCNIVDGKIHDEEHEDMKWLTPENIWSVDWLPVDVKVVKALEEKLA